MLALKRQGFEPDRLLALRGGLTNWYVLKYPVARGSDELAQR